MEQVNQNPENQVEQDEFILEQKRQEKLKELAKKYMPAEAFAVAESYKAKGLEVSACKINNKWYVYRLINRSEYQDFLLDQAKQAESISKDPNVKSEVDLNIIVNMRQENALVLKSVLYPSLDLMKLKAVPAGHIKTLYENIMSSCGFNSEPYIIEL